MKPATFAIILSLSAGPVNATASPIADDVKAVNQASPQPVATHAASETATEEFKPPRGFVARKRGKLTVYCSKFKPIGSRIETETCYDEAQMRDYMINVAENKASVDRIRSGCNYTHDCGQTDARAKTTK